MGQLRGKRGKSGSSAPNSLLVIGCSRNSICCNEYYFLFVYCRYFRVKFLQPSAESWSFYEARGRGTDLKRKTVQISSPKVVPRRLPPGIDAACFESLPKIVERSGKPRARRCLSKEVRVDS